MMWIASLPFWLISLAFMLPICTLPFCAVDEHKRGDKEEFSSSVQGFFLCCILCGVFAIIATAVGRL